FLTNQWAAKRGLVNLALNVPASVLRRDLHDLFRGCWPDIPKPLSLSRLNELAVMRECYPAVMVTKFQGCRGSVLEVRQMIAGEAVTQCVLRPFIDASG